jgi:RNA recognition motif-containing protein
MSKKIYVGNLPYQADENALKKAFDAIGEVSSVRIIRDETGRSKGFGFIEMSSDEDADKAVTNLNGTEFMGRKMIVNEARAQTEKGRTSGGTRGKKPFRGGRDQFRR